MTGACPCCGGEVTKQSYFFTVVMPTDAWPPFTVTEYFVCDTCEANLTGTDNAARTAAKNAFLAYLKKVVARG